VKNLLGGRVPRVLADFARGAEVALVFDYDGTLAPIATDRTLASMRPRTRELLAEAAERYPCAVLSGRTREDVSRLLDGVRVACVVGNHGAEWPRAVARARTDRESVATWRRHLEAQLAELAGVEIEDKGVSLAIHLRAARDKPAARAAIRAAIVGLEHARVVGGKQVVNLVIEESIDKGEALELLLVELRCRRAVFVGDDVTDEDVFARADPERILCVRVGRRQRSAAPYYIPSQREVDDLLALMLQLRAPQPQASPRIAVSLAPLARKDS
jgi:trehalose 6-phosphate phosphatase